MRKRKLMLVVAFLAGSGLVVGAARSVLGLGSLPQPDYSKDPVIMVHGFGGGGYQWDEMRNDLIVHGWPEEYLYAITFSQPLTGCNEDNARELAALVDQVLAETGKDKVDLLSHSMGGLSTRYYIKYLGGAEKVRDYVSLGSPHQGTYETLLCDLVNCGCRQMVPGSDFLNDLNAGDETPGPVLYTSIWSTTDECCIPSWECSQLDGAKMVKVYLVGHLGLMIDDVQVLPEVINALEGGGLNDN